MTSVPTNRPPPPYVPPGGWTPLSVAEFLQVVEGEKKAKEKGREMSMEEDRRALAEEKVRLVKERGELKEESARLKHEKEEVDALKEELLNKIEEVRHIYRPREN